MSQANLILHRTAQQVHSLEADALDRAKRRRNDVENEERRRKEDKEDRKRGLREGKLSNARLPSPPRTLRFPVKRPGSRLFSIAGMSCWIHSTGGGPYRLIKDEGGRT